MLLILTNKIMYTYEHRIEMVEIGKRIITETKYDYYDCRKQIYSLIEKVCTDENKNKW